MTENKQLDVQQLTALLSQATNKIIEQENTIKKLKKELKIATSLNAYYEKKEEHNTTYYNSMNHYNEDYVVRQMASIMYETCHPNSSHL